MKQLLLLMLFISNAVWADPLLVISIMVKNEEAAIRPTLEPFLQAGLKHFLVYDTGSIDKTVKTARGLFNEYGITEEQAHIVEEPFVNFAASRNRLLDLVDQTFPSATFTLMLDAEWYIKNVPGLIDFCTAHEYDTESVYFQIKRMGHKNTYVTRLIRLASHTRFVHDRIIHEYLDQPANVMVPRSVYFDWQPNEGGYKKSRIRWENDITILLDFLQQHPGDARTLYYLGKTYHALDNLHEAYGYYTRYIKAKDKGFIEDPFVAWCTMGEIVARLAKEDARYSWGMALDHYMTAFSLSPHRIEPLMAIALHYYDERNMPACYLFARRAVDIPFPLDDYHDVDQHAYDILRYDLLSTSAAMVGEFEVGEWAVKMALENTPGDQHFLKKLAQYQVIQQRNRISTEVGE